MRIEPRKQILDIWRYMLQYCYADGEWIWGGCAASNPIADAEQLLCLFWPITQIPTFGVHDPDATQADVASALRPLGEATRVPRVLVEVALQYFQNHTDENGQPRFGAGSYLRTPDPDVAVPQDKTTPGMEGVSFDKPSWYLTERIVEALVAAAHSFEQEPPRSPIMYDHLLRLLNEADHVYNQELLRSNVHGKTALRDRLEEIGTLIARARELSSRRTSTAISLAERALRLLDALEVARVDAGRSR